MRGETAAMLQNPPWTTTVTAPPAGVDATLVAELQRGNEYAVELVVQRYTPTLYRFIYYRVGDAETAEDLVSEVLVRMLTKVGSYVPGASPFEAWLFRIARNLIADHYRARKRRPQVSFEQWLEEDPSAEPGNPDRTIQGVADRALLQASLAALTPEQRQVVLLHVVEGWELPMVAQRLGISLPATKGLYYRGLHSLRRIIERQSAHDPAA